MKTAHEKPPGEPKEKEKKTARRDRSQANEGKKKARTSRPARDAKLSPHDRRDEMQNCRLSMAYDHRHPFVAYPWRTTIGIPSLIVKG
jgi:hypothetical protein